MRFFSRRRCLCNRKYIGTVAAIAVLDAALTLWLRIPTSESGIEHGVPRAAGGRAGAYGGGRGGGGGGRGGADPGPRARTGAPPPPRPRVGRFDDLGRRRRAPLVGGRERGGGAAPGRRRERQVGRRPLAGGTTRDRSRVDRDLAKQGRGNGAELPHPHVSPGDRVEERRARPRPGQPDESIERATGYSRGEVHQTGQPTPAVGGASADPADRNTTFTGSKRAAR